MKENPSQFAVIGLGRFGSALAKRLYTLGKEVLALDADAERVNAVAPFVTHAAILDSTDEKALKEVGLKNFDAVIVSIGEDMQASILTTLLCKEIGVQRIIAKAINVNHKKVLEKIGADLVVFPEGDQGEKLATELVHPSCEELAVVTPGTTIVKMEIPSAWGGKSLQDLKIRQKYGVTLIVVERDGQAFSSPDGAFVLKKGDGLVVFGKDEDLLKLTRKV